MIRVRIEKIMYYPPSKGYAVILKEVKGSRQLPIIVGVFEAQAIALALEKVEMPRPMIHDLFTDVMVNLDLTIREIIISNLVGGTFYAKVLIQKKDRGKLIEVDSRPSDAMALALRMGAPIYVAEKVMREAGQISQEKLKKSEEMEDEIPEIKRLNHLFELKFNLQKAVNEENYELAAKLRDQIFALEGESNIN